MSEKVDPGSEQERMERARVVKQAYEEELMGRANVVGVGVGLVERGGMPTRDVGIIVMVSRKLPHGQLASRDLIPSELEGVPVDVREVGEVRAQ